MDITAEIMAMGKDKKDGYKKEPKPLAIVDDEEPTDSAVLKYFGWVEEQKKKRKEEYNNYLYSKDWRGKRNKALIMADYQCERCGFRQALEVHHIRYDRFGNEDINDLVVLCKKCHREIEYNKGMYRERRRKKKFSILNEFSSITEGVKFDLKKIVRSGHPLVIDYKGDEYFCYIEHIVEDNIICLKNQSLTIEIRIRDNIKYFGKALELVSGIKFN